MKCYYSYSATLYGCLKVVDKYFVGLPKYKTKSLLFLCEYCAYHSKPSLKSYWAEISKTEADLLLITGKAKDIR